MHSGLLTPLTTSVPIKGTPLNASGFARSRETSAEGDCNFKLPYKRSRRPVWIRRQRESMRTLKAILTSVYAPADGLTSDVKISFVSLFLFLFIKNDYPSIYNARQKSHLILLLVLSSSRVSSFYI